MIHVEWLGSPGWLYYDSALCHQLMLGSRWTTMVCYSNSLKWTDARKTTLNPEFQEFEDLATRNESQTSSEWISKLRQAKWSVKIEVRSLRCLCYSNSSQDIQYLKNWSLLRKNAAQLEKWLSCRLLEEVTACQVKLSRSSTFRYLQYLQKDCSQKTVL